MSVLREDWRSIAARIEGIESAILNFAKVDAFLMVGRDPFGIDRDRYLVRNDIILESLKECKQTIQEFQNLYLKQLSKTALKSIERFQTAANKALSPGSVTGLDQLQIITAFSVLKTELQFHLADNEYITKKLTERAFCHLRRSIVADKALREKWQSAYEDGETACEKLGAAHLLSHGIWSFKVNTSEEKTDLVLGQPIDENEVRMTSDALILTEWKKAKADLTEPGVSALIRGAINQTKIYAGSVLSGFEIGTVRYIPIVSKHRVTVADQEEGGILYRVINIPVAPEKPSLASSS